MLGMWPPKWVVFSEAHRENLSKAMRWRKCKPFTEEHKNNISLTHKGKPSWHKWKKKSQDFIDRMSASKKWTIPWNKWLTWLSWKGNLWIKRSEETRKKMSEAHKGRPSKRRWEKSNFWAWWVCHSPYSEDRTIMLRRSIRQRDNYICQICNKQQWDTTFDVHHIDYDKKNCNPINLITLCKNCHIRTNTQREYRKEILLQRIQSFNF